MKSIEEKRKPLVADRFLREWPNDNAQAFYHPKASEQVKRGVRNARRFVFDEDAAERIAEIVIKVPDLLVREHQFARAPFELTWVELPAWRYWMVLRASSQKGALDKWSNAIDTADHSVGYLIDHGRVNVVVAGTVAEPGGSCVLAPLQYRLGTEWPLQDQLDFCESVGGLSRLDLDAAMWGSTWDGLDWDARKALRANNVMEWVPTNPASKMRPERLMKARSDMLRGSVGDLRTIIAILLVMNRPSLTRYVEDVPHHRGFIRGKLRPFMSHTTVQIALDPIPVLRLIGTPAGEAIERRRHEVRGTYCHDKVSRDYRRIAGCVHEYQATNKDWTPWTREDEATEGQPFHWVCASCGGKRWWRKDHSRGDVGIGFVVHDAYQVTDSPAG